ncbi:hypothetical protein MNV49_004325 [Pseudohyphozyma bogoriensis]|nr:hypothetical protein MNV49_004325 [Pseudohyphozyma bogoriensis]
MPVEHTFQGILFDMDGTLVDSTPAVLKAMGDWCEVQGVDPNEFFAWSHGVRSADQVRKYQTVPKLGTELTDEEMKATVEQMELHTANTAKALAAAGGQGITRLPGVEDLLKGLRKGGARWGLVTSASKTYVDTATVTAELVPPELPFRITGDLCMHGKPHPEPYLRGLDGLRQLGGPEIDPNKVLVVEDAPAGLASGLAAGCQTLAVCTSHTVEQVRAFEASFKVADLTKVDLVRADGEGITLRFTQIDEE